MSTKDLNDGEISVSLGITKKLTQYEFIRFDASLKTNTEDAFSPKEWERIWRQVEDQVEGKVRELNEATDA